MDDAFSTIRVSKETVKMLHDMKYACRFDNLDETIRSLLDGRKD